MKDAVIFFIVMAFTQAYVDTRLKFALLTIFPDFNFLSGSRLS
jgi:hypothetical protein